MIIMDLNKGTAWWVAMVLDATTCTHLIDGYHVGVLERGGTPRVKVDERDMEGVLRSVATTNESPFKVGMPSANATLDAAWDAARR